MEEAGPSCPALILGLNGAPQAGDKFNVMGNEKDARALANKREQLQREQGLRTQKHITLDEIGRRIAIGNFQELNIIVKGDVDGSIEALSDSLIKLSTPEIQVNVIHKAVGQISEGDVMLAAASNAIPSSSFDGCQKAGRERGNRHSTLLYYLHGDRGNQIRHGRYVIPGIQGRDHLDRGSA